MKKSNENKATGNNSFQALLDNLSTVYNDPNATQEQKGQVVGSMGQALAYSIYKKLYAVSGNQTIAKKRVDIARATNELETLKYVNDNATKLEYNDNGDAMETITDHDMYNRLVELSKQTLGDGMELVQEAATLVLEAIKDQTAREPGQPVDILRPYTVRKPKQKVWIKTPDSVNGWETVETTPLREIHRALRRYVASYGGLSIDPKSQYAYIDDLLTDPETGETVDVYRRLGKCANLGGYVVDFNGAETLYTVDNSTVETIDSLIAKMGLTQKQKKVLNYRLSLWGNKAIGTALGIKEDSVKNVRRDIKAKAVKIGLVPKTK